MANALGVKIMTVATPSLHKKVLTFCVRMRDREDLTGGVQHFFLGRHNDAQRKSTSTVTEQ